MLPDKAVEDAKSAMRPAVRTNAAKLGIDPNRIVSCGGSSGGHLASSVAALADFDAPGDDSRISASPNAMMLHYPLLDFLEGGTRTTPFLDALDGDRELGEPFPGQSLADGSAADAGLDRHQRSDVRKNVKHFVAKWKDAGGDLALYIGEGGNHGFSTTGMWRERSLARIETLRKVGCFEAKPALPTAAAPERAATVIRDDVFQTLGKQFVASKAFAEQAKAGDAAAMTRRLQSPDSLVRVQAVLGLLELGRDAEEAFPLLVKLLMDDEAVDSVVAAQPYIRNQGRRRMLPGWQRR